MNPSLSCTPPVRIEEVNLHITLQQHCLCPRFAVQCPVEVRYHVPLPLRHRWASGALHFQAPAADLRWSAPWDHKVLAEWRAHSWSPVRYYATAAPRRGSPDHSPPPHTVKEIFFLFLSLCFYFNVKLFLHSTTGGCPLLTLAAPPPSAPLPDALADETGVSLVVTGVPVPPTDVNVCDKVCSFFVRASSVTVSEKIPRPKLAPIDPSFT